MAKYAHGSYCVPELNENIIAPGVFDKAENINEYTFSFTGHGYGAVLAIFAAQLLRETYKNPYIKITVTTFGAPRFGNHAYATLYLPTLFTIDRVTFEDDHVPLFFSEFLFHDMGEIWITDHCDCVEPHPQQPYDVTMCMSSPVMVNRDLISDTEWEKWGVHNEFSLII
ncbi:hypothetical protein G9A89_020546 [Geosiphon pyriformis]|nr:hypothetical protein G9A89_020546 [Geosiphon pyriformis]